MSAFQAKSKAFSTILPDIDFNDKVMIMAKDNLIVKCNQCGAPNRVKAEKLSLNPICGKCKSSLPMPWISPVYITDNDFQQEVLESPIPVLVDFWSPKCRPCAEVSPLLDQIANELAGKLKICKINVDQNARTAVRFGVNAVPTMLFFRGGLLIDTMKGALPKESITGRISRYLHGN